jgi:hypothetical protein
MYSLSHELSLTVRNQASSGDHPLNVPTNVIPRKRTHLEIVLAFPSHLLGKQPHHILPTCELNHRQRRRATAIR